MTDEHAHLRSYAASGDEQEFAAVVQAFLPMVYAAALRRVYGDAHRAQDVTQLVFVALARNARTLATHPDLPGWLFTTTRFLAAKALRADRRRQTREQQSVMNDAETHHAGAQAEGNGEGDPELQAMLDEIVADLKQVDRQVILLRFHRGLRLAQIGEQLGVTENAVQKRLDRALEQLKEKLSRRGITSTATAVALALEQQSAVAVPAGLTAASTQAVVALGASGVGALSGTLGTLSFMAMTKVQIGAMAALVFAGTGAFVWQRNETAQLRTELTRQTLATQTTNGELMRQVAEQRRRAEAAEADVAQLLAAVKSNSASLPRPSTPTAVSSSSMGLEEMREYTLRADKLRREGKFQEAVDECVKGYREARARRPGGPESQYVMGYLMSLGRTFPPATEAVRGLRDTATRDFEADSTNRNFGQEVATLNQRLGDGLRNVALYDQQPPDSPLRQTFGIISQSAFVEARRYNDALIVKNYGLMLNELDMSIKQAARPGNATPVSQQEFRDLVATSTAKNIEVLTGVGQHQEAKLLSDKLLAFDNSPKTQALIKEHVARAGGVPNP